MPPEIDYDKCTGCRQCIDVCAEDVFFGSIAREEEKPVVTYPEACFHCYLCQRECPEDAIRIRTPLVMHVAYK